jgi:hypothetical protein
MKRVAAQSSCRRNRAADIATIVLTDLRCAEPPDSHGLSNTRLAEALERPSSHPA